MGSPTIPRPVTRRPSPARRSLGGRLITPMLLALAAIGIATPLLIIETDPAKGRSPGEPGSILLSETAPVVPGRLDVMLLIDRSSSYEGDLGNMAALIPPLLSTLAIEADLRIGVASFIDGTATDPAFELNRPLTEDVDGLGQVIRNLDTGNAPNDDAPEMALSALDIVLESSGFRADAQAVVVMTTDAVSKTPSGQSATEVGARYAAQGVRVVALVANDGRPDARYQDLVAQGEELATATGGSMQELQSTDSSDVDQAILRGLENVPVEMQPRLFAGCPIEDTRFSPSRLDAARGGARYDFDLDFVVNADAPAGLTICTVDLGGRQTQSFELFVEDQ